jgi:hypothetical protein
MLKWDARILLIPACNSIMCERVTHTLYVGNPCGNAVREFLAPMIPPCHGLPFAKFPVLFGNTLLHPVGWRPIPRFLSGLPCRARRSHPARVFGSLRPSCRALFGAFRPKVAREKNAVSCQPVRARCRRRDSSLRATEGSAAIQCHRYLHAPPLELDCRVAPKHVRASSQ